MPLFPPIPDVPRATARVHLRFEDITQTGRVVLEALPNALSAAVWHAQLSKEAVLRASFAQGIVPILTRFVLETEPGPFSANVPMSASGAWQIARVVGDDGRTEKLVLNMWAEMSAPIGHTYAPPPADSAPSAIAGRIFAEHVFTRPFAAPGERRVTTLGDSGTPDLLPIAHAPPPAGSLLDLPPDARPIDDVLRPDPTPIQFGLVHTDSNQHVNSLVYLRLFEEAALRRFAELGLDTRVIGSALEIAYRKPCFAGDGMRVALRAFESGGRPGLVGVLVSESDAASPASLARARPRAFVRVLFAA